MASSSTGGEDGERKRRKVTMQVVESEQGKTLPIVAYYPTAFDPKHGKQDDEDDPEYKTELYRNTEKFKTAQVQLVARTHDNVDFVGSNSSGETASWQPTIYAMGVFDKEEGTLKVVPILANKVVRMEPRIRGVSYSIEDGELGDAELDSAAKFQKRVDLVNRFGTKKSKTGLQRWSRSNVTETSLKSSAEEFKGILQSATEKEGLLLTRNAVIEAANQALDRKIPPYNLEATTLEDAYPLDKIITTEEWEALDVEPLIKAAKSPLQLEKLRNSQAYPKFILDRLPRLKTQGDLEGTKKRARILAYMKHLMALFNATIGRIYRGRDPNFNEKAPGVADIPEVIYNKLKSMFIVEKPVEANMKHSNNALQRDYLLSYILVLGLKVDGYEVDPYDAAVELKMTVTELEPHYQQLGCKIEGLRESSGEAGRTKSKASLVLPLKLVDLEERKGGKKRGRGR